MARGLAGEGILPTFKHFPGHGDTAEDSHTGLAYSYRTVEELTACELLPFEAAAEVGPRAVMVGHIVVPELTGDLPATLCADAIALVPDAENTLIVTDSLAMGAITDSYTPGEAAVQALQARVRRAADARRPGRCLRCCAGGRAEWHPQRGPAGPER